MESKNLEVIKNQNTELDVFYDNDELAVMAAQAEKRVANMNKIMSAAVKMTSPMDWCVIGGKPYLQESGACKVARLFGIGWSNVRYEREIENGYPVWYCYADVTLGGVTIEAMGARSGADEFFAGKDRSKGPDQIDIADVKKAAYTNCLNNGIKRILPGLRNIDLSVLEANGINTGSIGGYTFKSGSKGGNSGKAEDSGLVCACCKKPVSQKVASYSQGKFGRILCMEHQKKSQSAPQSAPQDDSYDDGFIPEPPPEK